MIMSDKREKKGKSTRESKKNFEKKPLIDDLKLPEASQIEELQRPPETKPVPKSKKYRGYKQRRAEATTKEEKDLITMQYEAKRAEEVAERARQKLKKLVESTEKKISEQSYENDDLERLQKASEKAQELVVDQLDDSVAFSPNPGPQTSFLASAEDEVLYGGARGGGKSLILNDFFLTTDGLKEGINLQEGDVLVNPDGSYSKLIKLHEVFEDYPYKMSFSNGAILHACKNHLWYGNVRNDKSDFLASWDHPRCVKDTSWIYEKYQKKVKKRKKFMVPLCEPLQFSEKELLIDPYILGCLIGDGTIGGLEKGACKYIKQTTHIDDFDFFYHEYMEAGFSDLRRTDVKGHNCADIRFVEPDRTLLESHLTKIGLWGTRSGNKFIPKEYLYGSIDQRFALLQGLMDTDGCVEASKKGNDGHIRSHRLRYYTTSKQLSEDFVELCSGLGYHTKVIKRPSRVKREPDGTTYECSTCYQIEIRSRDDSRTFRLPRKKELVGPPPKNWKPVVYLDSIEKLDEKVPMRCITVDHPNNLYMVTGASGQGYVASHNTYSLIADPLRYVDNPNFKALLFRRTTIELRDIIRETRKLYPKIFPTAKYLKADKIWEFPSGATIEFAYAESVDDAERYRGQQYSYIGFDELGQHPTPEIYDLLIQSLRTTDPELKTYMRATANPGGVGAWWLKERFIDAAPANTRFWVHSEYIDPRTKELVKVKKSLKYIPATVFDNPYLMQDQSYVAQLAALPEAQKEMMLYGNWDVVENGAFPEFNRRTHTCQPFEIPKHWPKFRAIDWGYSSPFCVLWFAMDEEENIWVYREYYGKGVLADEFAREVIRLTEGEYIQQTLIDGSVTAKRGEVGPSIMETLQDNGLYCGLADRSPGSRILGKQQVHQRLALRKTGRIDEDGNPIEEPAVKIFNTCVNLIRTLPLMVPDENEPEKVQKKNAEDHAYDAFRYGLSSRPLTVMELEWSSSVTRDTAYNPVDSQFGY